MRYFKILPFAVSLWVYGACSHTTPQLVNASLPKSNPWEQKIAIGAFVDADWKYFGFYDGSGTFEHQYGGEQTGFFEYSFVSAPSAPKFIEVKARLSAESHEKGKAEEISDVTVSIDGFELGTQTVVPDDMQGKIYVWRSDHPALLKKLEGSGKHTLRFEVKADAKHRFGLCLYGEALDQKTESQPITVHMQAR